MTMRTVHMDQKTEPLRPYAAAMVTTDAESPILRCDWCGRECDTHEDAHDDPEQAVLDMLWHAAYSHASPSTLVSYRPETLIVFARD